MEAVGSARITRLISYSIHRGCVVTSLPSVNNHRGLLEDDTYSYRIQRNMAPHAMETQHASTLKDEDATQNVRKPVQATGVLEGFDHEDLTPAIGRAFHNVNIIDDLMNAEDADARLRELSLISM